MIIVVPSCLKDADGARTRSDQKVNDYSGTIVYETRSRTRVEESTKNSGLRRFRRNRLHSAARTNNCSVTEDPCDTLPHVWWESGEVV